MLKVCYKYVNEYQLARKMAPTVCKQPTGAKQCDALVYGSLHLSLTKFGLYNQGETSDTVLWTVTFLATQLLSIEILELPVTVSDQTVMHDECNIQGKLRSAIWTIFNRMPSAVHERHYAHMRRQRDILS